MRFSCNIIPTQTANFNHSQLENIKLKNLALSPSNYTSIISENATINWANVDFQPINHPNRRVWQFRGSAYSDQNNVDIFFIISTSYDIQFEGPVSGTITSSVQSNAASGYETIAMESSGSNQTIIRLQIKSKEPLDQFGFDLYIKDESFIKKSCKSVAQIFVDGVGTLTGIAACAVGLPVCVTGCELFQGGPINIFGDITCSGLCGAMEGACVSLATTGVPLTAAALCAEAGL